MVSPSQASRDCIALSQDGAEAISTSCFQHRLSLNGSFDRSRAGSSMPQVEVEVEVAGSKSSTLHSKYLKPNM